MPKRIKIITFIVVILFTAPAFSAEDLYKVEVIVFRDTSRHDTLSDNLGHQLQVLNGIKAKELTKETPEKTSTPQPYTLLPENYLILKPEEQTLLSKKGFKILAHIAWIQPIMNKKNAIPVHIYGGDTIDLRDNQKVAEDNSLYIPRTTNNPRHGIWELDGAIKISENYSISVNTDLVLTIPSNLTSNGVQQYYMNLTQHVQLHELHYFDHPFFGVLTKITPFNFQEETDTDGDDDSND